MSSRYCNIKIEDMSAFLKADKGWEQTIAGREVVFDCPIKSIPHLLVRVYTGILADSGQSRGCGGDAIRTVVLNTKTSPISGYIKAQRVYRTTNWQINLKARVVQAINDAKKRAGVLPGF